MLRRVALVRTNVSKERAASISFYPENVGDKFLRNVGSKKTHMAPQSRRRHSSCKEQATNVRLQQVAYVLSLYSCAFIESTVLRNVLE
jgi:hypothetical protein